MGFDNARRYSLFATTTVLAVLLFYGVAQARTALDQKNPLPPTGVPDEYVSFGGLGERVQTFTAGKTGTVESVYLYLKREQAKGYDLSYGIGPTDANGRPEYLRTGDTILASAIPERGGWVKLPIDNNPSTTWVTAGEQYNLYVFSTCGGVCTGGEIYAGATGDSYAGGTSLYTNEPDYSNWIDQHTDWAFITYVTPPPDTTAPTGKVVINGGVGVTPDRFVTLRLKATDPDPNGSGVTHMRIKNAGATWSVWRRYATSKDWVLSTGEGTKTVYAQFRDAAGNVSARASDSIIYRR